MDGVVLASRLLLAALFAVAGAAKLRDRDGTATTLEQFGLAPGWARPGALLLPLAELGVAALLVFDPTARAGAAGAIGLLAAFAVAISASLARGERPDCNCFGQVHSEPVGASTLVRNGLLALPAGLVLAAGGRGAAASALDGLGGLDTATSLAAAALALVVVALGVQAWVTLHLMRQHGRILLSLDQLTVGGPVVAAEPPRGLPVGAPAPDFALPSADGSRVGLRDLLDDERPLVLAFADPDCSSCRKLAPELAELQRDPDGARVAVVVTRTGVAAAREMASQYDWTLAVIDADGTLADGFEVSGTPAAVAIGPEGLVHSDLAMGPDGVRRLLADLHQRDDGGLNLALVTMDPAANGGPAPGEPLPDVELDTLDGERASLLGAARGKPHLLLFWNPECGFCDAMLEDVRALEKRGGTPMLVIATGDASSNRALGLRSRTLLDPDFANTGTPLGVAGTPSALRVDSAGRVVSALAVGADAVLALAGTRPVSSAASRR
jgi:thiol-disulfide isomerase/thioredoxin/uncharacterized membrane protein YphA (DoxX/SURF4 family)